MNHFIGQFHPALVHLPIGILVIALIFRLLSKGVSTSVLSKALTPLLAGAVISSLVSALSGYLLSGAGGYEESILSNHKWAGFGLTGISALLYVAARMDFKRIVQNMLWWASALLLFITGHLGGQLTHGEDYLSFSFKKYQKPVIKNMDSALVYHDIIEPILADKCWSCHSSIKQKGALRLDGIEYILKGGKHGDVVSSPYDQSKMYHRLSLPKSADDHMPPSGQPQPTAEEVKLISWWLQSDVTKDKPIYQANAPFEIKSILTEMTDDDKQKAPSMLPKNPIHPVDPAVLSAINTAGITAIPVAQNSNYLNVIIHTSSSNNTPWALLRPVEKNIVWLSARRVVLGDTAMAALSQMNNLIKLDLSYSTVNDLNLASLSALVNLKSLNLNGTAVSENGLSSLKNLKSLQSLFIYQSKVNPATLPVLRKTFAVTQIDTGNYIVPIFPGDTTEYTYEQLAKDKKAKGVPITK